MPLPGELEVSVSPVGVVVDPKPLSRVPVRGSAQEREVQALGMRWLINSAKKQETIKSMSKRTGT